MHIIGRVHGMECVCVCVCVCISIHPSIIGNYRPPQDPYGKVPLCPNLGGHYFTATTYQTWIPLLPHFLIANYSGPCL